MASPTSFRPLLEKWCKKVRPSRILEWGPGESTKDMIKWCPDAKIISIEHQKQYFEEWDKYFNPDENVLILLREAPESDRSDKGWKEYIEPSHSDTKFDLIFVDGRERVKCMKYALSVLSEKGVVLLHDAERGEYNEGINLYDIADHGDGTFILKPKAQHQKRS